MSNNQLKPYRVTFTETPGDQFKLTFDCQAEDADHAAEQAQNAYPGCEIIHCAHFDELVFDHVVYSPSESANGAGFWSPQKGWVGLDQASWFTKDQTELFRLPEAKGNDAKWVTFDEAKSLNTQEIAQVMEGNVSWPPEADAAFSQSEAIKAEYLASGCEASDVDFAVRRLMAECADIFKDDRAAWEFLMEETHEERGLTAYQEILGHAIDCMLQDDSRGQAMVFIREGAQLVPQTIDPGAIDLENLEQYEMVLIDGGNSAGDSWKHVFYPKQGLHHFVDENPLPTQKDAVSISYSVDGGVTWNQAREGVRIAYSNVLIDGEDQRGELLLNASHESLITDLWTHREPPQTDGACFDHNIGSSGQTIDDLVTALVADNE